MSGSRDTFVDGTDAATPVVEFPEVVASLEAIGFTRLGRLGRAAPGEVWRWAAAYPRRHRDEFSAHLTVPPVVLRAPDASAFASVGWWWGMPDVRFRTALADGSVVETLRQWDQTPVPPRGHRRIYAHGDLREEQLVLDNPDAGRSVTVARGEPDELWLAHQDHVAAVKVRRGGAAGEHTSMTDAVALANRLARHQRAWLLARRRLALGVLLTIMVVGVLVVVVALTGPPLVTLAVLVAELVALGLLLATRRRIFAASLRRRYRRRGRPALGA